MQDLTMIMSKRRADQFMRLMSGEDPDMNVELEWFTEQVNRSQKGPFGVDRDLTPALSRVLLELNVSNRRVSETILDTYVHDIMKGRFAFNGEPIIIARTGELNDGQHRCWAVLEAQKSLHCMFVFGVERETRMSVDTGLVRTVGSFLSMGGTRDANNAAAVAKYLLIYRSSRGTMVWGRGGRGRDDRTMTVSKQDIQAEYNLYASQIQKGLAIPTKAGTSVFKSKSVLAFCAILFARATNWRTSEEFMHELLTGQRLDGAGLPSGHPALTARQKFFNDKGLLRDPNPKAEIIMRTWNAWRRGETRGKSIPLTGNLPHVEK